MVTWSFQALTKIHLLGLHRWHRFSRLFEFAADVGWIWIHWHLHDCFLLPVWQFFQLLLILLHVGHSQLDLQWIPTIAKRWAVIARR